MLAKILSLGAMLLLLGCRAAAPEAVRASEADVPTRFRASIGRFLSSTYVVELDHGRLNYSVTKPYNESEQAHITPTTEQWVAFRKALDELKLWQWRTNYPNPNVLDGTGWSIEIQYADRSNQIVGVNSYPKTSG